MLVMNIYKVLKKSLKLRNLNDIRDLFRSLPQQNTQFKLSRVRPENHDEVLNLFWTSYLPHEPIHKSIGVTGYNQVLAERVQTCLSEGLSLAAKRRDDDKIIGVAINTSIHPWSVNVIKKMADNCGFLLEDTQKLLNIFLYIQQQSSLFEKYPDNKVYDITYLMTAKGERYKGVAEMLVKSSHADCRDLGFDIFKIDCTHSAAIRICEKLNYSLHWQMGFKDYKDDDAKFPLESSLNGRCVKVFIDFPKKHTENVELNVFD